MASVMSRAKSHAVRYLSALLAIAVIDVVRNVIVANALGPYLTGLCTTLLIIPQIAQYFNLGTIDSLPVLVPRCMSRGRPGEADDLRNQVLSATTVISMLSFIGVVVLLMLRPYQSFNANAMVVIAALLIFFYQGKKFFVTSYAADNEFRRLSAVELVFTILVAVTQIWFVKVYGVYGFWAGLVATNLLVMFYLIHNYRNYHPLRITRIDLGTLKPAIHLGIPMLIYGVLYVPFMIFARIFLAKSAGMAEVGYFILAMLIIPRMSIIPAAIAKVLLPKISHMHAVLGDYSRSFEIYKKAQFWTFLMTLLVFACGAISLGPVIRWLMPKYIPGIAAAKMILLAGIPYCLIDNATNFLLAMQRKRVYVGSMLVSLVFQGFIFLFLQLTHKVTATNIAISMILVFSLYAAISNFMVIRLHRCATGGSAAGIREMDAAAVIQA